MKDGEHFSKVIADISILYELALAAGQSLDLETNCDRFLGTLMARKNLGYASVWIRGRYLGKPAHENQASLVYSNPQFRTREKSLPLDHPIFTMLKGKEALSLASAQEGFREIITENGIDRGTFALFTLGSLGVLKLFSMTREVPFKEEDLNQLKNVISKFALSVEGCIDHQRVTLEISERERAEKRLLESETRYRRVIETALDVIFTLSIDGLVTSLNPAFERLTGWSPGEWFGKVFTDLVHPQDSPLILDQYRHLLGGRRPPVFECRIRNRSGGYLVWEFAMAPESRDGKVIGILGIARDITGRKQALEALRQNEEKFQRLFDEAPVGYHDLDAHGCIVQVNRTELDMLGYTAQEILGQPPWKFVVEEQADESRRIIMAKLSGTLPPSRGIERVLRRKDGTTLPVLIEDTLIRDGEGRITGIHTAIQDMTEHKRAEKEMADLQEQFLQSQKMEAVGRLAGGIAHDFNNLLTVITGYANLSLSCLKEGDPLWGNIKEIEIASQRATDLTRQLLAFSRRQVLQMKVLDLNRLIRNLEKMLQRILGEDIELQTVLAEDLGKVKVDPGQMEQVVMNLAVNARDAMPSGGRLTIETENVKLDEEFASSHVAVTPGRYVELSVRDTGLGMSREVRENIFEPFFTTKEKGKGTGLGLSTVYGIIKQSGGNIRVYSEPGQGTIFRIYLPRSDEDLDDLEPRDQIDTLKKTNETILMVEDETAVRGLAVHFMRKQGYTVWEAENGKEALRIAEERAGERIDLLMTDVVMPQVGGKELAERLKISRPDLKVLFVSGYTDDAVFHHGVLEPGIHFMQKPFSLTNLARRIREILESG